MYLITNIQQKSINQSIEIFSVAQIESITETTKCCVANTADIIPDLLFQNATEKFHPTLDIPTFFKICYFCALSGNVMPFTYLSNKSNSNFLYVESKIMVAP